MKDQVQGAAVGRRRSRSDLNRVIQWMSSELSVGHHTGGGGDRLDTPRTVPGGLLGADYTVENGRYRFKKVYGGLNWTPQLRAPLTEPGVNVRAGEYLTRRAAAATCGRRPTSTASSRTPQERSSRSPWAPTPTAAARAPCRSCRSRTKPRCAIATGSRGT